MAMLTIAQVWSDLLKERVPPEVSEYWERVPPLGRGFLVMFAAIAVRAWAMGRFEPNPPVTSRMNTPTSASSRVRRVCQSCGGEGRASDRHCSTCGSVLDSSTLVATRDQPHTAAPQVLPSAGQMWSPPVWPIRQRPIWLVFLLVMLSLGHYWIVWFGQTWSELKRVIRDPGMRPLWHALSLAVPFYGLFRIHAHFRAINEQSPLRMVAGAITPGLAVAGLIIAGFFDTATRRIPDSVGILWLGVDSVGAALVALVAMSGQRALNRIWEPDFGVTSRQTACGGQWVALLVLGVVFGLAVLDSLESSPVDMPTKLVDGFAK
jgi:hypothetical protein